MSQPSPNVAPAVSSVPWATPDTASPTAAPGDRYGYAPESVARQSVPASYGRFPGVEYVNIQEVFADGGYTSPKPITNPMAKVALWFAVFGVFGFTLVVSIVLAVIALVQAQSLPERIGSREAIAALVYDGILVFVGLSIYLLGLF
ncbi:MAG: hypothetical protein KH140_02665 [Actinomyces sp.]|nr:hypothetical protein [Actinomyces sp.]